MEVWLVEFACDSADEPRVFLLDDKKMDDWCMAEPPQGYKLFRTIWHGELERVITCLNDVRSICEHQPR